MMYLACTKYTLSSRLPKDDAKDTVDDTLGLCTVHIVQQAGYEQPNLPTDDPRHTEDDQHGLQTINTAQEVDHGSYYT